MDARRRLAALDRLQVAAELRETRDSTDLTRLKRDIADLRGAIADLGRPPEGDLMTAGFAQSGGLVRWQARCRAERERLNMRLAQLLSRLPDMEKAAGRSAARRIVVTKLKDESDA